MQFKYNSNTIQINSIYSIPLGRSCVGHHKHQVDKEDCYQIVCFQGELAGQNPLTRRTGESVLCQLCLHVLQGEKDLCDSPAACSQATGAVYL